MRAGRKRGSATPSILARAKSRPAAFIHDDGTAHPLPNCANRFCQFGGLCRFSVPFPLFFSGKINRIDFHFFFLCSSSGAAPLRPSFVSMILRQASSKRSRKQGLHPNPLSLGCRNRISDQRHDSAIVSILARTPSSASCLDLIRSSGQPVRAGAT